MPRDSATDSSGMKTISFITFVALVALGLASAPAGANTNLVGSVVSNAVPAFQELAEAYAKKHPGTTITILSGSGDTISKNTNRGLSSDFIVIGDNFMAQTQNVSAPARILENYTVIIVAPDATSKITKPEDLSAPGIRIGSGTAGGGLGLLVDQTFAKLDTKYGNGFLAKVKANVTLVRTQNDLIAQALKAGKIDAAILFAADAQNDDLSKIEIGECAVSNVEYGAALKSSTHLAETKDFLAFAHSPEGIAIIRKHGHRV